MSALPFQQSSPIPPPCSLYKSQRAILRATKRGHSGAISVMFVVLLIPLLGLCALAIDLGLVYNRKAEMRNIAHAVALAAAKKLNGTAGGIGAASAAAASTASTVKFKNLTETVAWTGAALSFGTSSSSAGTWMDASAAAAMADHIYYVKVDTHELQGAGNVHTYLAAVLDKSLADVAADSEVIAGRTSIDVAPIALCAMSLSPAAARANSPTYIELVEYGFRRGISYDLMQLNPGGTVPLNFVVNPVAAPGTNGDAADLSASTVGPHACSGSLAIARVTGDPIAVGSPFPLGSLYKQLNSRFDEYDSALCTPRGALPDVNVKAYEYTQMPTPLPWMTIAPAGQTAAATTSGGKLQTVADLPPPGGTSTQYGPLWANAKAVPFSAYTAGVPEPGTGYTPFATSSWPTLYGGQTVKTYPTGTATPYKPGAGVNWAAPDPAHGPGWRGRRILNVPLLDCSGVVSGSAKVVAVGKFFMTVPATPTVLAAEFGGVVPIERISGTVGVFP